MRIVGKQYAPPRRAPRKNVAALYPRARAIRSVVDLLQAGFRLVSQNKIGRVNYNKYAVVDGKGFIQVSAEFIDNYCMVVYAIGRMRCVLGITL